MNVYERRKCMSDYSKVWEEMHEDKIKMEHNADKCK